MRLPPPFARLVPACLAASLSACGSDSPPPPHVAYAGLPVSGSLADARFAGFTECIADNASMRCRRHGVRLFGQGPFEAAVDLDGSDGGGGFSQLTLWDDRDQSAVFVLDKALAQAGWQSCSTGENNRGDQAIYTRAGAPVRFAMDISYWGKRRFRILPAWSRDARC